MVAVQSPRVPKLGMFVGPPELPTGYRARAQDEKGKISYTKQNVPLPFIEMYIR